MARYTYVISDIHGQYDALMEMMTLIQFSEEDELYILGDVIDRGPKSIECMKWIRAQDNVLTLLGNHELLFYDGYIHGTVDLYNTLTEVRGKLTMQEQTEILKWIEEMPECKLITVSEKRFYLNHTQAASDAYFKEELTDRMFPDDAVYKKYNDIKIKNFICIHGHIPTMQMRKWCGQKMDFTIWKNESETIIDIDCGAGYPKAGGRLGCLRLNDMEEFYVTLKTG